jgi:L,D-peptidoglycan transpeptidase YkuD (ErfK/YbiS/YcfS/YnhG family)
VACTSSEAQQQPAQQQQPSPQQPPAPQQQPAPQQPSPLDGRRTLLVGVADGWTARTATLRLWRRDIGGAWTADGPAWPASLGHAGLAWGVGAAPPGRTGPTKREGDGKAPAGLFDLTAAYGYLATGRGGLPYQAVDEHWRCVDDEGSKHYNDIVDERAVGKDWSSAEDMRRGDDLYRWVVVVDYNGADTPGAGSCVFLHLWRKAGKVTAGCTAMAAPAMERLLDRLALADRPAYLLLPAAEYDALAAGWGLPPRSVTQ